MGNTLEYPSNGNAGQDTPRSANNLQRTRPVILPFDRFNIRPDGIEETDVKSVYSSLDSSRLDTSRLTVETTKINTSATPSRTSSKRGKYIKRYRNEEDKLLDMLKEREALLRSSVRQGQQLRAKCNRYKEEIDSLKAINSIDMTNSEWKKKYNDLDKKYRDLKEEMEVMTARNKNGRDYMKQQNETIEQLNLELQQERLEKAQIMHSSLPSLQTVGVKDKKGKKAISQLQIDKNLLAERVQELTVRNQRGREYLAKLESEKKEQDAIISKLNAQLLKEKADKETLLTRNMALSSTGMTEIHHTTVETEAGDVLYAQVKKIKGRKLEEDKKVVYNGSSSPKSSYVGNNKEPPSLNNSYVEDIRDPPSPITDSPNYGQVESNTDPTERMSIGHDTQTTGEDYEYVSGAADATGTSETTYRIQRGSYEDFAVLNGQIAPANEKEVHKDNSDEEASIAEPIAHTPCTSQTGTTLDINKVPNPTGISRGDECITKF